MAYYTQRTIIKHESKRVPPPRVVKNSRPHTSKPAFSVVLRRWGRILLFGIGLTVFISCFYNATKTTTTQPLIKSRPIIDINEAHPVSLEIPEEKLLREMPEIIQSKHGVGVVESCRWLSSRNHTENLRVQTLCQSSRQIRYIFNPSKQHARHLCDGTKIERESLLQVTPALFSCSKRPTTLFPVTPELDAKGMPPIVLRFGGTKTNGALFDECDVPCMNYGRGSINTMRTVEAIDGSEWKFVFSMEGEDYYANLKIDPYGWKMNKFWATTSFKSEVPLPYYSKAEYSITGLPAVNFDKAIKGAVFLARNCASRNNREELIRKLQASAFRVDSLSSCLNNAEPPPDVDLNGNKETVLQHYLFYLAFENQCVDDYITEKLWGPLAAGTVPIYYGASNVKDHVPNNSLIHVDDFSDTDQLIKYLNKVANDKSLYESYQTWRTKPLPPHFHAKYDLTDTHSTCRMCRWAYARQYGLGWNQTSQSLRELVSGPRHVCLGKDGLIQQPFQEYWQSDTGKTVEMSKNSPSTARTRPCKVTDDNRVVLLNHKQLRRTVWYQDGVTDLLVENKSDNSSSIVLQLQTPLTKATAAVGQLRKVREGVWHMQDEHTRFTILTLPRQNIVKPSAAFGAVTVVIPSVLLRLRVIVEDIDSFNLDADREENFFGKLMAEDFFIPPEVFVQTGETIASQ